MPEFETDFEEDISTEDASLDSVDNTPTDVTSQNDSDTEKTTSLRASLSEEWEKAVAQRKELDGEKQIYDQKGKQGLGTVQSAAPTFKVPRSWSKEASEWLTTEPKTIQEATELRKKIAEYAARRQEEADADYTSKTQKLAQEREAHQRELQSKESVYRTLEPKIREFALRGVNPESFFNEIFALDELAKKDKKAAIAHLAKNWGVDFNELVRAQQQSPIPPVVEQKITALERQLAEERAIRERTIQAQHQQYQQAQMRQSEMTVQEFMNSKDETGNLRFPHVDKVRDDMIPFINMIRSQNPNANNAQVLEQAYQKAVWANDDIRQEILAQQQRQEAAQRLVSAKKAASPITSSPNGNTVNTKRSLRDDLALAWDEHVQ
jgi:hypothetical protein